ncbi:hypothetical protein BH09PLA1_BH09PLA1_01690 [soil metagenome]
MAKTTVRLIHWNDEEAAARLKELRAAGATPDYKTLLNQHKQMRLVLTDPPEVYVIDLSRMFSHGREIGMALRQRVSTRRIPLIFVDGDPEKRAGLKSVMPDATYTTWPKIKSAIATAMKPSKKSLVVPPPSMSGYSGTPLPQKLGIKPCFTVALHEPPERFDKTLGPLPDGAKLKTGSSVARDLTIWFVRSNRDLRKSMPRIVRFAHHGPVWIASPKKASGIITDVTQNDIRNHALASGLVDYKVCAIDATWSGLLFCLRKTEG